MARWYRINCTARSGCHWLKAFGVLVDIPNSCSVIHCNNGNRSGQTKSLTCTLQASEDVLELFQIPPRPWTFASFKTKPYKVYHPSQVTRCKDHFEKRLVWETRLNIKSISTIPDECNEEIRKQLEANLPLDVHNKNCNLRALHKNWNCPKSKTEA